MTFLAVDNPVMHAELRHQRHIIRSSRSGWFWIVLALLMLVPAFLAAVMMLVIAFSGQNPDPVFADYPLDMIGEVGIVSLIIMHFALYIVVTLVTLALAARSINREIENHTWESLLLTEMTARQIVQGKWWATLRALWGDHLMVLILRLGFVAWINAGISQPHGSRPAHLLVGMLFVLLLTVMDSALSVILGILPPVSGSNPVLAVLAGGLRIGLSLAVLALTVIVGLQVADWPLWTLVSGTASLGVFALLVVGMLRFTEWAAVRNLASPIRVVPV